MAKFAAVPVDMRWTALDAQLLSHLSADEKEARDVAFIREFLRKHPDDAHLRSQLAGHLTGSGFVLDATRTRVLLLHHGKLNRWLQPGGHGEGETDPRLIALREIEEETGLAARDLDPFPDSKLLDVDVHRIPARQRKGDTKARRSRGHHVPDSLDEPAHAHLDLRYGFVARVGAQPRMSDESRDLRWFALDELPPGVDDSLRRAVRKLVEGRRSG